jgi:hypothetical protein
VRRLSVKAQNLHVASGSIFGSGSLKEVGGPENSNSIFKTFQAAPRENLIVNSEPSEALLHHKAQSSPMYKTSRSNFHSKRNSSFLSGQQRNPSPSKSSQITLEERQHIQQ